MFRPFSILLCLLAAAPLVRGEQFHTPWPSEIQALMDRHCVKCHGPLEQKVGLELDTLEAVLKGSEDGPVVTPGKPDDSKLIAALEAGADPHMPPKKQLPPEDVAKFRTWIAAMSAQPATDVKATADATPKVSLDAVPAEPAAAIDYFIEAGWKSRGITPAPLCDDRTFVRRLYLDLAGRIPTRDEVDSFLFDGSAQKRETLVDRLLAGDEYPRTFRETWDAILMGRGAGRRDQKRRENHWYEFLESAFRKNRPWNEVVRAVITARPDRPEDKGAFWFLYEKRNDHQRVAEAIAPVIYGTRVDCAQCHDHPLAREIKQGHYWGLVAAFNRSKNVEKGPAAVAETATGGFINFTNLKKESQPATMMMLTGRTIDETRPPEGAKQDDAPDGYVDPNAPVKVPKFSRRAALAEAATIDNPLLARAFVNYTWAILMGRGIVHPVDEMNTRNKPSHPEMLEWLAKDFAAHNFDMRRVVRAIVLSRAYQNATWTGGNAPDPSAFAAATEKPLTGEAIARSVRTASGRPAEDEDFRRAVVDAFPDVLPRVVRSTIQQAMFLANSDKLTGLFKQEAGNAVDQLGNLPTPEARARQAFRNTLIREPDPEELAKAVEFLNARTNKPDEAAGQLLWALVAGPEFLTNH